MNTKTQRRRDFAFRVNGPPKAAGQRMKLILAANSQTECRRWVSAMVLSVSDPARPPLASLVATLSVPHALPSRYTRACARALSRRIDGSSPRPNGCPSALCFGTTPPRSHCHRPRTAAPACLRRARRMRAPSRRRSACARPPPPRLIAAAAVLLPPTRPPRLRPLARQPHAPPRKPWRLPPTPLRKPRRCHRRSRAPATLPTAGRRRPVASA